MSKTRRRNRFYVITFPLATKNPRRCRTCREFMQPGERVWSPYFHGGYYHMSCEATPGTLPDMTAPPENQCMICGWYKMRHDSPACSRCVQLGLVAVSA